MGDFTTASPPLSGSAPELSQDDFFRIRPKLAAAFSSLGAADDELEDLIQETFLEAHRRLHRFEGRSSLDTWVVSVAKGVWLHHRRRQRTLKRDAPEVELDQPAIEGLLAHEMPKGNPDPEALATWRQLLRRVGEALAGLPENLRQPLLLKVEGLSYQQIAGLLGIAPKLVSSRIHEARDRLRRQFPERKRGRPR